MLCMCIYAHVCIYWCALVWCSIILFIVICICCRLSCESNDFPRNRLNSTFLVFVGVSCWGIRYPLVHKGQNRGPAALRKQWCCLSQPVISQPFPRPRKTWAGKLFDCHQIKFQILSIFASHCSSCFHSSRMHPPQSLISCAPSWSLHGLAWIKFQKPLNTHSTGIGPPPAF